MYNILKKLLFQLDPEKAHSLAFALGSGIQKTLLLKSLKKKCKVSSISLAQTVAGVHFKNPIGLAAGFDKNGELLPLLDALGFGHIEVGSVTALASKGNPKPRLFRLPEDRAIINRMGLNNDGVDIIAPKLQKLSSDIPFAVNISKTHSPHILGNRAIDDFLYSYEKVNELGLYTTINISCPNTEEGKTFESDPQALGDLLSALDQSKKSKPLFLKISPDLSNDDIVMIANKAKNFNIDGFVVGNTSGMREGLKTSKTVLSSIGRGGLSGAPLKERSNQVITSLYRQACGEFPIIGTGGIMCADDVIEKIRCGASITQVYTGLIFNGPLLVKKINNDLIHYLEKNSIANIEQLRGSYHAS